MRLPQPHRVLDHTADVGFEVEGRTREEVFERAALALLTVLAGDAEVPLDAPFEVEASADPPDEARLLVRFLKEVLVRFQDGVLAGEVEVVDLAPGRVRARGRGWRYDPARLEGTEVKGVTYHGLRFERRGDGWAARVVLDV